MAALLEMVLLVAVTLVLLDMPPPSPEVKELPEMVLLMRVRESDQELYMPPQSIVPPEVLGAPLTRLEPGA